MTRKWFQHPIVTVLLHAAFWAMLFYLPYLLRPEYSDANAEHKEPVKTAADYIVARITDLLLISFFYFNAFLLIPGLFFRRRYVFYFISLAGCYVFLVLTSYYLTKTFTVLNPYFNFRQHLFFMSFIFLFFVAISVAYAAIRAKIIADNLEKEKENQNLKTELSLLRMQVSPHFMFNVLNNMVSLARKQSDLLEPSLIKLSSLMRYMLYETGEEKVSLEKETDYLQSYIDLQQQRFGKKLELSNNTALPDKPYDIEPMLLIPFVENAFKHGTGMIEQPFIHVMLSANNGLLNFSVSNKYHASSSEIKDKDSGIGLANVQRRLELLYPQSHMLTIDANDGIFTVNLQINIES